MELPAGRTRRKSTGPRLFPGGCIGNVIFEEIVKPDGDLAFARNDQPGMYDSKMILGNEICDPLPRESMVWPSIGLPIEYGTVEELFEKSKRFIIDHVEFGNPGYYDVA